MYLYSPYIYCTFSLKDRMREKVWARLELVDWLYCDCLCELERRRRQYQPGIHLGESVHPVDDGNTNRARDFDLEKRAA